MDPNSPYFKQVQLLVNVLPVVAKQECFALKGGTAINLFIRDLPRLSVDIDLVYLPDQNRYEALAGIDAALKAIQADLQERLGYRVTPVILPKEGVAIGLNVQTPDATIKIEVNHVMRGTVHKPAVRRVRQSVEQQFGFAEITVVDFNDLYAGKLCAALDRQHPRDLFDVMQLQLAEGIDVNLKNTFIVYLLSHPRPIAEVLSPNRLNIDDIFNAEFNGMTTEPVNLESLYQAREAFIGRIHELLTDDDRQFLLSFKNGAVDWSKFAYPDAQHLPAIRWKLHNLEQMNPTSRKLAADKLAAVFTQHQGNPDHV